MKPQEAHLGEVLVTQGSAADKVIVVKEGQVKLAQHFNEVASSNNHNEALVGIAAAGMSHAPRGQHGRVDVALLGPGDIVDECMEVTVMMLVMDECMEVRGCDGDGVMVMMSYPLRWTMGSLASDGECGVWMLKHVRSQYATTRCRGRCGRGT